MATPAIRLSVEVKADPAVVEAILALAASLSGLGLRVVPAQEDVAPVAPPPVDAPVDGVVDVNRAKAAAARKLAPVPAPAPEAPEAPKAAAPSELDIEDARAAAREMGERKGRDAVVALLGEFETPSITAMLPKHYAAFIAKARA